MATNIGPKIGIDGEKEFRANLKQISQQLKTLGTEMKAVTSAFDANDKSQENLSKQADVLNRQIALQEDNLKEIERALEYAKKNYKENSDQVQRWQQALNNATTDLNKMRRQLSDVETSLNELDSGATEATDAIDDIGDAADDSSGKLGTMNIALGNMIADGVRGAIDGFKNLVSQIWQLDSATEDYRKAQGRVTTAFESAGYTAQDGARVYEEFYKILGDTDTAAEASQLLAKLADDQQDLSEWTRIAAGVSGTFGDSLPIEGLIEASNETAKVGTVTGVLADALNWAGISEDQFNARLAECSNASERNSLIMETLAGTYSNASDAFYKNNEALVESRENQSKMSDSLADVGEAVGKLKNSLLSEFAPVIQQVSADLAQFIQTIDTEAIANGVRNAFQWVKDNGPKIISVIAGITAGFVALKAQMLFTNGIQSISALSTAIGGIKIAWQGVMGVFSGLSKTNIIIMVIAAIVAAVITLWNTSEDFRNGVYSIVNDIKAWLQRLEEDLKQLGTNIVSFFSKVWNDIKAAYNSVEDFFTDIFTKAFLGIKAAFATAVAFFISIRIGIEEAFSSVVSWFIDTFSRAWNGVKSTFADVYTFYSEVWNKIKAAFSNVTDWAKGVGEDIVNGIWDGIAGLWEDLTSWFNNLWNSLFGNRSVSVNASVNESRTVSYRNADSVDGSHASGLDYVPFDGYIAQLHKGEMVLTAAEADRMRQPTTPERPDFAGLAAGVVNGIQTAMTGTGGHYTVEIPIIINGQEFSRAILPDLRSVMRANPQVVSGV